MQKQTNWTAIIIGLIVAIAAAMLLGPLFLAMAGVDQRKAGVQKTEARQENKTARAHVRNCRKIIKQCNRKRGRCFIPKSCAY